jgi:hypothetical protein
VGEKGERGGSPDKGGEDPPVMSATDGATTRKERILDMLRFVESNMPRGLSNLQIQQYMSLQHGLKYETTLKLIQEKIREGMLRTSGSLLVLDESEFKRWIEILGIGGPPAITVQCRDCGCVYSSKRPRCPECESEERDSYDLEAPPTSKKKKSRSRKKPEGDE